MFCVMWFETASSSSEPVAASAHQSACRASGRRRLVVGVVAGDASLAPSRPAARGDALQARRSPRRRTGRRTARSRPTSPSACARVGDPRLEQERIADERQHRREIRQREQPIRARARTAPREPRLHQRARRRQQEVRQADRRGEQAEDQPRRVLGARRASSCAPGMIGSTRRLDEQQRDVQLDRRARREPAHGPVGVRVAGEQRGLEEHEARRPDRRRAAEPRQDLLRDDRLHAGTAGTR